MAGYTRIAPGFGLRMFMVDYNKLKQAQAGARRQGSRKRK